MSTTPAAKVFTGRSRRKQTPWSVRAADAAAKWCITVGGIGTIVAVSLVFLFLFSVVAPLFLPARVESEHRHRLKGRHTDALLNGVDEFRTIDWSVDAGGRLRAFDLTTGRALFDRPVLENGAPTSISKTLAADDVAIGSNDGSVRFGRLQFGTTVHSSSQAVPAAYRKLAVGKHATFEQGVITRTRQSQWRVQKLEMTFGPPVKLANSAIRFLDHVPLSSGDALSAQEYLVAYYAADGQCQLCQVAEQENQFTGEKTLEARVFDLPVSRVANAKPFGVFIAGRGDNVYLVFTNGLLQRFDVRDPDKITLIEEIWLLGKGAASVTACHFVLGRETLVVADSRGGLRAWFRTKGRGAADGHTLTMVHDLSVGDVAVTALRPSERSRAIVAGYADGSLRVFHVTTEKRVLEKLIARNEPVRRVAIAPKENGLVAATDRTVWSADLDPRHPEVTLSSLFRPVWYEGYDEPLHIWQSSYATSAPEMKLGLMPLVFGTIKATVYTMLFAAPLALLAAVYTSEFMHPRTRALIKPTIEMMASLPSVVLGFLAALVLAPLIEKHVTAAIATVFLVPLLYLLAAHLWQALPQRVLLRWERIRLVMLFLPLPLGIAASLTVAPILERWLFGGDVMRWLDRQIGTGVGAWLLLWLPMCTVLTLVLAATQVNPLLRGFIERCGRAQYVLLSLMKFLVGVAFTVGLAFSISWLLDAAGWDPRGSYVATYVQRNAFVVGAVMGFAIIPIIYTLADDALSAVPQHLRSASLGCGATRWQTAIRVVVPTAMSGLFSALMIGLGRAVGETMIVLMAGGNTPVMEWNVFNGFRTLAANIATELPEAVQNSTHYRTLFLAALTLFVLTFCLNTVAEMVRLRFRRRAYQL